VLLQNVICPDSKSECPDGQTCCVSQSSTYACCNAPLAVCCEDKVHCCPNGFRCAMNDKCEKGDHAQQHPLLELDPPPPVKSVENNVCPDKKNYCSSTETCCRAPKEEFGCCTQIRGVCCSDLEHCCPEGMKCDVPKQGCIPGTASVVKGRQIEDPVAASAAAVEEVGRSMSGSMVCPDGTMCADGCTCCKRGDTYGCCPLFSAVCCSDEVHCCPSGFTCNGEYCESQLHPLLSLLAAPTIRMEGSPKDAL